MDLIVLEMNTLNDPIDRRMVPRREEAARQTSMGMRSRRTFGFWATVLVDVIILLAVRYTE